MRSLMCALLLALVTCTIAARANDKLPFAARQGLTGDTCKSEDDCNGDRKCAPRNTVSKETCDGRLDCLCKPGDPRECQKDSDCEEGELCAFSPKNSDGNTCRSVQAVADDESFTPVNQPGSIQASPAASEGVCIDLDALAHLSARSLVFQHHPLAHVLCDQNSSCATPGHIVIYNNKPMMMQSYCQLVSCTPNIIRVNSPRYGRALRVPSRTTGLEYTALAARYQTAAEETVLGTAVRVGL